MSVMEACVRCRTHYVDSTGEYNFVRQVIERFNEEAKKQGVALVSCCAFDSVPGDLGNYVVHQGLGAQVSEVRAFYQLSGAGMSGGTARSVFALREACCPEDSDPYSLLPTDASRPVKAPTRRGLWYDVSEKRLTGPFVMAATNERVVRRTNALLGYGGTYVEAQEGTLGVVAAATITRYLMAAVLAVPFLRRYIAEHWLPPVGAGPTQSQRELSWYKCVFVAVDKSGKTLRRVVLSDTRDAYTASDMYIAEAALSALQRAKEGSLGTGALMTPMAAFGDVLLHRVRQAGVVVEVVEEATASTTAPAQ
ncbi:saccharopine dehydrogenase [Trypanosoma rangeli]|uniref:Saccharopine dehydrogenase n=1 Tax=Trypanosoma rangeli TaxID=5698 RepID=A0A422NEM4_TRYRA|nr:saccharopine dehydrogenase [Trypanosoma rangeli]RNF03915.1 saccharopine dehydrogenase [Trypanosoma rangeli]|eukprot:RNF03915.1 saccharopine dehydrogenase [Trypanosoma rangeli]